MLVTVSSPFKLLRGWHPIHLWSENTIILILMFASNIQSLYFYIPYWFVFLGSWVKFDFKFWPYKTLTADKLPFELSVNKRFLALNHTRPTLFVRIIYLCCSPKNYNIGVCLFRCSSGVGCIWSVRKVRGFIGLEENDLIPETKIQCNGCGSVRIWSRLYYNWRTIGPASSGFGQCGPSL